MADDTRDPSAPSGDTPPEGLRVVPVDLETVIRAILTGQPMPEVLNVTFLILGSVLVRARQIEAEYRIAGTMHDGQPYDPEYWRIAKQELVNLLDQARRIVTVEDYEAEAKGYDLAAMAVSTKVQ